MECLCEMDARAKKLCDKIIAEARSEAAQIIDKAKAAARDEIARAEAEAKASADQLLARERAVAERDAQSRVSMGQLDLRNDELAVKQELIESVFNEALERLKAMTPGEYSQLVSSIVLRLEPQGAMELLVAESDRGRLDETAVQALNAELKAKCPGTIRFGGYTDSIETGFALREGDVALNFSFVDILSDLRETMEGEVASILFQQ